MNIWQKVGVIGGLSLVCGLSSANAAVIYSEDFNNGTGADSSLSTVGWISHWGTTGLAYDPTSSNGGNVPFAVGLGYNFVANGGIRVAGGLASGTSLLISSTEIASANASVADLSSVSFHMRNQLADIGIRFAVQVGSSWYVTSSVSSITAQAWELKTINLTTTSWNSLSFTPDTDGSPYTSPSNGTLVMGGSASLPTSGIINAVGFFTENKSGSSYMTFDNLVVNTVPEPSSVLCLGLGAVLLSLRKRRK